MLSLALEEALKVLDFCLIAKLIILSCLTVFLFSLHFFPTSLIFREGLGGLSFSASKRQAEDRWGGVGVSGKAPQGPRWVTL